LYIGIKEAYFLPCRLSKGPYIFFPKHIGRRPLQNVGTYLTNCTRERYKLFAHSSYFYRRSRYSIHARPINMSIHSS
jgi:hypothetical protein